LRRRDVATLGLLWGGLLAGLVWALSTQFRWVRENKPLVIQPLAAEVEAPAQAPANATGVIGEVNQDTREAMARDLEARRRPKKARKPGP